MLLSSNKLQKTWSFSRSFVSKVTLRVMSPKGKQKLVENSSSFGGTLVPKSNIVKGPACVVPSASSAVQVAPNHPFPLSLIFTLNPHLTSAAGGGGGGVGGGGDEGSLSHAVRESTEDLR